MGGREGREGEGVESVESERFTVDSMRRPVRRSAEGGRHGLRAWRGLVRRREGREGGGGRRVVGLNSEVDQPTDGKEVERRTEKKSEGLMVER